MENRLNDIIESISYCLATEKSYNLPSVCNKYNLDNGEEDEAFRSKANYVRTRIIGKSEQFILNIAKQLIKDYQSYEIGTTLNEYTNGEYYQLTEITRRKLVDKLLTITNLEGKLSSEEIMVKSNLSHFVETDAQSFLFSQPENPKDSLIEFLKADHFYKLLDNQIFTFLEVLVNPIVRNEIDQSEIIDLINQIIRTDNVQLAISQQISDRYTYKVEPTNGVKGKVKNLIFASNSYKPEIVIKDALNNDLEIVSNKESVLIYDEHIPQDGLKWIDLVKWWAKVNNKDRSLELAMELKSRLFNSLDSKPEKDFFNLYYNRYAKILGKELPALIPQVYLHYDPYTINKHGIKYLLRQRMDFLILFSNSNRVVIEIDGKQHYANGDRASPEKYSEMIRLDRELKFLNYNVYRLGGFELTYDTDTTIITFIDKLFEKYL